MKIGIIGAGNMGRTLGLLWLEKGHEVFFFGRNKESNDYLLSVQPAAKIASAEETLRNSEVILYCLREVLPSEVADRNLWNGKIILDINNWTVPADFKYAPVIKSFSERYQEDVPEAFVVKAFNHMAQEVYYHPTGQLQAMRISGYYAGNESKAKEAAASLIGETGLIPVDCGGIESARLLETFADMVRLLIAGKGHGPYLVFESKVIPESASAPFGVRQPSNFR